MSLLEFFKSGKEPERGASGPFAEEPQPPMAGPKSFSARSQRSLVEQLELTAALERCEAMARITKEHLRQDERLVEFQTNIVVTGIGTPDCHLPDQLARTENRRKQLQAFEDHGAALQSKITSLRELIEAQTAERRERQFRLARLANLRLKIVREIDARLEGLRSLLGEYSELTCDMRQEADGIQLTCPDDYFDEARFVALKAVLPADLAKRSGEWVHWFFGAPPEGTGWVVNAKIVTLPETLAAANVFVKGQRIVLTEDKVKSLGKAVGPAIPTPR